jgi:hypothetical protein
MLNRTCASLLLLGAIVIGAAAPAAAQQTLNFSVGYFAPLGEDARVEGDVLNSNRNFLVFDVGDFGSASVGAEWLVGIGEFVEAGAGLNFTRRTVPSVYEDFVDNDGTEIDQDLRLRIVPVSFTVRVVPTGQSSPVQPYFGAGLGVFNWRYSESGEFVDFSRGREIFRDQFVADGNQVGLVALAGLRFAGEALSAGGEIRYQKADAELDDRFAGPRLDLGGWTYQFNLGIRFR